MSALKHLFSSGNSAAQRPDYTGLQIQTAVNALPIPIVWGTNKIAPNLIWYANFQAHQSSGSSSGGGGKGGIFGSSSSSTTYTYTADVILAMCDGQMTGVGNVWPAQSLYNLA